MNRSGGLWIPTHYSLSLVGQTMGGRGAEFENGHMLACALKYTKCSSNTMSMMSMRNNCGNPSRKTHCFALFG